MITAETRCIDDILSAPTSTQRLQAVAQAGLDDEPGVSWLASQLDRLAHSDPERALALGEVTLGAARLLESASLAAGVHYALARVRAERGEFDDALELIGRAHDAWADAGDALQALRTHLGRMQILDDLGRHAEAARLGESILDRLAGLACEPGDGRERLRRTIEAAAWGNLGVAAGLTGDHEGSVTAFERSERRYADLGMGLNVAQQQANRGIELVALGRAREAVDVLDAARQAFTAGDDVLWAAKCAGHLADALVQCGRVVDAIGQLQQALTALDGLGSGPEEARLHVQLARAYLDAGLFAEARASAGLAVGSATGSGMVHDRAFGRLALSLALLGDDQVGEAADVLDQAAADFETAGDRQFLARATLLAGQILQRQERWAEAERRLLEAEQQMRRGGWRVPLAWTLVALADQAGYAGCPDLAARRLAEAERIDAELALPALTRRIRLRQARLLRAAGRVGEAELLLSDSVASIDASGTALPSHLLQLAFHAEQLASYDDLVELLVERDQPGDAARALSVSDRAKAQALTGLLSSADRRSDPGWTASPSGASARLRDLHADLSATFAAMHESTGVERQAELHARAHALETAISDLTVRLSAGSAPATRQHASRGAGAGQVVLAYHVLGDRIVALIRDDEHTVVVDLGAVLPQVRQALGQLVAQWGRFAMGSAFVSRHAAALEGTTRRILGELYDLLVAPVRPHLDQQETDQLLVVPHRLLHGVPFHALNDGTAYLLQRWTVTLAATSRSAPRGGRTPYGSSGALVMAAPDARAPHIEREAALVGAAAPGTRVLVGPAATVAELERSLPGPTVLHLACHGLYRSANPLFSAIRLADRWLTAAEVLALDLTDVLVVLSACESGRRSEDTAEAVGLAWSFLGAGAAEVVVSQWVVDDSTTVDLMSDLHRLVAAELPPAAALRQAQLRVMETHPHPYYWAPFVCVVPPAVSRREHVG